MKRPSDWPLHFVLYPTMFKIYPVPILARIQERSREYIDLILYPANFSKSFLDIIANHAISRYNNQQIGEWCEIRVSCVLKFTFAQLICTPPKIKIC